MSVVISSVITKKFCFETIFMSWKYFLEPPLIYHLWTPKWAWDCTRDFTYEKSLNSFSISLSKWVLLVSFYRGKSWDSEGNLSIRCRTRISIRNLQKSLTPPSGPSIFGVSCSSHSHTFMILFSPLSPPQRKQQMIITSFMAMVSEST